MLQSLVFCGYNVLKVWLRSEDVIWRMTTYDRKRDVEESWPKCFNVVGELCMVLFQLSGQSRKGALRVLLVSLQGCRGTCHKRHRPVAMINEACKMMILTWDDLTLDVA